MKKNNTDQSCGIGNVDNASGYTIKAIPGPVSVDKLNIISERKDDTRTGSGIIFVHRQKTKTFIFAIC